MKKTPENKQVEAQAATAQQMGAELCLDYAWIQMGKLRKSPATQEKTVRQARQVI
jgi:hypothetical protein